MKKSILIALACFSFNSFAGDIACAGRITFVMADHKDCVDDNGKKQLAFRIDTAPSLTKCANSDAASAFILKTKFERNIVSVYISDENSATCNAHTPFIRPSYMFIQ